jgi:hypothetical protein
MAEEITRQEAVDQVTGGLGTFSAPIPGASLTQAKESPQPYETAPEIDTPEGVTQAVWQRLRDNEEALDGILDSMRDEIPLEDIAQIILFEGFRSGQFNPDVMLLSIEPIIYMLAFLANWAEIPVEIYPEEDFDSEDEEDDLMDKLTMAMDSEELPDEVTVGGKTLQRPDAVPASLLSTRELPTKEGAE